MDKPADCPYCGYQQHITRWHKDTYPDGSYEQFQVSCGECEAKAPIADDRRLAIKLSKRVGDV